MRSWFAAVALSLTVTGVVIAGKNATGALIVHTDDTFYWRSPQCTLFEENVPQECELLNTRTDRDANVSIIWMIAAFDTTASPGVRSITFGNDHNLPVYWHNRWGYCGPPGTIDYPDAGWPEDPRHAGNQVVFSSPIVGDAFFPFYYVEVWGFQGAYYGTGVHPTEDHAAFIDDSSPPEIDVTAKFGQVRWYESGYNVCPEYDPAELGACCLDTGTCIFANHDICTDLEGWFHGPGGNCDPNPCRQPLEGACCLVTGECRIEIAIACEDLGGEFMGGGIACDSNPCLQLQEGVCCISSGECRFVSATVCEDLGGIFVGEDIACVPNPCYGACCFYHGGCEMQSLHWCEPMGGEFMGAGSHCDPNPCVNSSVPEATVREITWGAIKARYRE